MESFIFWCIPNDYPSILYIQVLYEFVFSSRDVDLPFCIFQCYPCLIISCSQQSICEANLQGTLSVADGHSEEATDPIVLLNEAAEVRHFVILLSA